MVVPFAHFVFICALSMFLQETWLNSKGSFEAFDAIIKNLPQTVLAGKTAEIITKGGIDMIKYLIDYLAVEIQFIVENTAQGKAKDLSEWVN